MILTSNRGFAEWGEGFGDPVVATVRRLSRPHPGGDRNQGAQRANLRRRARAPRTTPTPAAADRPPLDFHTVAVATNMESDYPPPKGLEELLAVAAATDLRMASVCVRRLRRLTPLSTSSPLIHFSKFAATRCPARIGVEGDPAQAQQRRCSARRYSAKQPAVVRP
jgi:hypothetical protein